MKSLLATLKAKYTLYSYFGVSNAPIFPCQSKIYTLYGKMIFLEKHEPNVRCSKYYLLKDRQNNKYSLNLAWVNLQSTFAFGKDERAPIWSPLDYYLIGVHSFVLVTHCISCNVWKLSYTHAVDVAIVVCFILEAMAMLWIASIHVYHKQ